MKIFILFGFYISSILLAETFLFAQYIDAKVKIATSLPDFAAISKEIGGDRVAVKSIAKGYQDPHFVDAKPSYILLLNRADLMIYNGLGLETGWLPILITGSRNSRITSMGSTGHLDASTLILNILEVPTTKIDRSMGDTHPGGNPHYLLNPRNAIPVAKGIAERLIEIDPENSSYYEEHLRDFVKRLGEKIDYWESELAPYKGTKIVTYHKSWVYFSNWAGFEELGFVEPKPGIPPTPSHVASLIKKMEQNDVNLIIAESYYPQKTASLIAKKTGATFLVLPSQVGAKEGVETFIDLFDVIVKEVSSALKHTKAVNSHSNQDLYQTVSLSE